MDSIIYYEEIIETMQQKINQYSQIDVDKELMLKNCEHLKSINIQFEEKIIILEEEKNKLVKINKQLESEHCLTKLELTKVNNT